MPSDFEQAKRKVDEAASKIEQELRKVIRTLNDEVVPKMRTEGTQALRSVAQELQKLADRLDDSKKSAAQQK